MSATATKSTTQGAVLYLAFEFSWLEWKLAMATAPAEPPRLRTTPVGMIALTGTTSATHMKADREVFDFRLRPRKSHPDRAPGLP
jgi:hypothetical protein